MRQDEILDEIHKTREEDAKSFNYDLVRCLQIGKKDSRKAEEKLLACRQSAV